MDMVDPKIIIHPYLFVFYLKEFRMLYKKKEELFYVYRR